MYKDAFYFPHFCNARNDKELRLLRQDLGVEGYGAYFMLLEALREQSESSDSFYTSYPVKDIDLLADEFGISEIILKKIIFDYGLFEIDEKDCFFSKKLNSDLLDMVVMLADLI